MSYTRLFLVILFVVLAALALGVGTVFVLVSKGHPGTQAPYGKYDEFYDRPTRGTPVTLGDVSCVIERWQPKRSDPVGVMLDVDGCDATALDYHTAFEVLAPGYPRSQGLWRCLTTSTSGAINDGGLTTVEAVCDWEATK